MAASESDEESEYEEEEEDEEEESHFLDGEEEEEEDEGEEEEDDDEEEDDSEAPPTPSSHAAYFTRHRKVNALLLSKYDSVWQTTRNLGWKPFGKDQVKKGRCQLCWSDKQVSMKQVMKLNSMQKINHFPGMLELCRKAGTARNLNKMLKAVGKAYNIFPKTFMLPADYTELKKEWEHGKSYGNKTFIVKPSQGCQGHGIRLTRCLDEISPSEPNIVQRYMHRPHLLGGYKYDLRLYVLVSSLNPLRVFLFREGLVRVCTQKYQPLEKNMGDVRMHLTNYSINKDSEAFVQPEDEEDCADAHKRTISSLMKTLAEEGHDTEELWQKIGEVCVKTLIAVQPHLEHTYSTARRGSDDAGSGCFELLGFDIMMDYKLKPFLLEVNHTPSFRCDSPLDEAVKMAVLRGTMEMVSPSREEWRLTKHRRRRFTPELREHLVSVRDEYELHNADRLGFDTLYPPNAATCGGDAEAAVALRAQYDTFREASRQLYDGMSVSGSRRQANNCSSGGPKPMLASPSRHGMRAGSTGSFHATAAAAIFKDALAAGLQAGNDQLRSARAADANAMLHKSTPKAAAPTGAPAGGSSYSAASTRGASVPVTVRKGGSPMRARRGFERGANSSPARAASPAARGGKGKAKSKSARSKSPAGRSKRSGSPAAVFVC